MSKVTLKNGHPRYISWSSSSLPSSINACRAIPVDHCNGTRRCNWASQECHAQQEHLGGWPGTELQTCASKALVAVRQDRGCPGTVVRASLCTVSQHMLRGSSPVSGRKGLQTMRQTLFGTTAPCSHLEGLPDAQPHRQVETRLCPGKDPGDGTQRLQASQSLALGRPAGRGGLLSGSHAASTAMQA